ncbi:hypothetical protein BGW80DRAFT_1333820, partial [Lactifluus volemus]
LSHAFHGIFLCVVYLEHFARCFVMSTKPSTSQLGILHHSGFRVEYHQRESPLPLDNMDLFPDADSCFDGSDPRHRRT